MRRVQEPQWVFDDIVTQTGLDRAFIIAAVRDFRHVVDELMADDYSLFAGQLILRRTGDPVYRALRDRLEDPAWQVPPDLHLLDVSALADLLAVEDELVDRYPVAWWVTIILGLVDLRRIEDSDPDVERLAVVLDAWLDTFGFDETGNWRRSYRMSEVGLERHFEAWITDRLELLHEFGNPVVLGFRQRRFANGRIPDLVCRVIEDTPVMRVGDWLIVENKATMVGLEALDQIQNYMTSARTELAEGDERVFGLLLADGVTVELQTALFEAGVGYISLAALGYRKFLHLNDVPVIPEPDAAVMRAEQIGLEPPTFTMVSSMSKTHSADITDLEEFRVVRKAGPWTVGGVHHLSRSAANRALAALLGPYSRTEWESAQRVHGLR